MINWSEIDKSWTLFLDRDGVINVRNFDGYITTVTDFQFLDHADQAIAELSLVFGKVIVCTNQQGIAKGLFTESNLEEIHRYMTNQVEELGGKIDAVFFAGEMKTDPNNTRKPKPDMAIAAKELFPEIDFQKAIMIGDTNSDLVFGRNLGMTTILIETKELVTEEADFTLKSLNELTTYLK